MLNVREKLIELLKGAAFKSQDICLSFGDYCEGCPYEEESSTNCRFAIMVDHLIENGVTVRDKAKWKLRIDDCDCEYVMCSACGAVFYNYDEDTIDYTPDFCVGCGADMRGEEHEID